MPTVYKCSRCGDETDDLLEFLPNGSLCHCGGKYKPVTKKKEAKSEKDR
jgi:DNA-directed RNA polymerase subunit RPC12/RpoP